MILQGTLIALGITGVVGLLLVNLYRDNRLLFWCVAGAVAAHFLFAGSLWAVGIVFKEKAQDRLIAVIIQAPDVKKVEPPKVEEPEHKLELPLGRPNGDRDVTKIKKGSTLNPNAREGAKGKKVFGNDRTISSPTGGPGDVGYDPDAKGYNIFGPGDSLDVNDLNNIGKPGGGGDDWGDPKGDPDGGVPAGFAQGKRNGRVYFVRLKYGDGAGWFQNNEGTQRLLAYLNRTFPCETDTWPMSTGELRKKYLNKGLQPTFLYAYCDDKFHLSTEDVLVLRDYMKKGGFLFLDSRCDPAIKEIIAREMDKVLPGQRLAPLPGNHLVYRFLYVFAQPVPVGLNLYDRKNYGISSGGRLVVFYSMGDLSYLYDIASPETDANIDKQYQLGANVMLYAITKGNPAGFTQVHVSGTVITSEMLQKAGLLNLDTPETKKTAPGESVKIKKETPATAGPNGTTAPGLPDNPDEIKVIE